MQVKFLTLNLYEGGIHFDAIRTFLEKEKPDIACFQELYTSDEVRKDLSPNFSSLVFLQSIFPGYHSYYSPELREERKEGVFDCGNAIFSRFPIIEKHTVFYDKPYGLFKRPDSLDGYDFSIYPKNLQHAEVALDTKSMHVFNTHGIWGFHGDDTDRRLHMAEVITQEIKGKTPVVLAGDFNLFPKTQTVENIEKYLVNVFGGELKTTFNLRLKPHKGTWSDSVVDMVFVSRDVKVFEKYQPDVDVSDHFPLVCKIDL